MEACPILNTGRQRFADVNADRETRRTSTAPGGPAPHSKAGESQGKQQRRRTERPKVGGAKPSCSSKRRAGWGKHRKFFWRELFFGCLHSSSFLSLGECRKNAFFPCLGTRTFQVGTPVYVRCGSPAVPLVCSQGPAGSDSFLQLPQCPIASVLACLCPCFVFRSSRLRCKEAAVVS